jgi:hypothetical protein
MAWHGAGQGAVGHQSPLLPLLLLVQTPRTDSCTAHTSSFQGWQAVAQLSLTQLAEAQDVEQGVHVRLGREVDSGAHVAEGGVDVLLSSARGGRTEEWFGWCWWFCEEDGRACMLECTAIRLIWQQTCSMQLLIGQKAWLIGCLQHLPAHLCIRGAQPVQHRVVICIIGLCSRKAGSRSRRGAWWVIGWAARCRVKMAAMVGVGVMRLVGLVVDLGCVGSAWTHATGRQASRRCQALAGGMR